MKRINILTLCILMLLISFPLEIFAEAAEPLKPNPELQNKPRFRVIEGGKIKTPQGVDHTRFSNSARLGASLIIGANIGVGGVWQASEEEILALESYNDKFKQFYDRSVNFVEAGVTGIVIASEIAWQYLFQKLRQDSEYLPYGVVKVGDNYRYISQFYDVSVGVNFGDICNGAWAQCYVQKTKNRDVIPDFYQAYLEIKLRQRGSDYEFIRIYHITQHEGEYYDDFLVTRTDNSNGFHTWSGRFSTYAEAVEALERDIRTGESNHFSGFDILEMNGVEMPINPVIGDRFISIAPIVEEVPGVEIAPDETYIPAIVEIDGQRYWETFELNPNYIPDSSLSPAQNPEYITIYEPITPTGLDINNQPYYQTIPSHVPQSFTPPSNFDPPTGGGLDFSKFIFAGEMFINKFPFSIPWDLKKQLDIFNVEPQAPVINVDVPEFVSIGNLTIPLKFDIDFTQFDTLATIIRWFTTLLVDIGFILMIRRLLPEG